MRNAMNVVKTLITRNTTADKSVYIGSASARLKSSGV